MLLTQIIFTIAILVLFIAVIYWAYNPKQKKRFSDAEQLPFSDHGKSNRD